MTRRMTLLIGSSALAFAGWLTQFQGVRASDTTFGVTRSDEEWRRRLSPEQYSILRQYGTEAPGSSPLDHEGRVGRFDCVGCDQPLFSSAAKFNSHTGWPSFWQPLPDAVATAQDRSFLMSRTAVICKTCGGHLGHVFNDGPKPTGLRYCMNGKVLSFQPA